MPQIHAFNNHFVCIYIFCMHAQFLVSRFVSITIYRNFIFFRRVFIKIVIAKVCNNCFLFWYNNTIQMLVRLFIYLILGDHNTHQTRTNRTEPKPKTKKNLPKNTTKKRKKWIGFAGARNQVKMRVVTRQQSSLN